MLKGFSDTLEEFIDKMNLFFEEIAKKTVMPSLFDNTERKKRK